jgi:hypothetical protein
MSVKTGRLPARRPAALKDLGVYATGPLPTPPPSVGVPKAAYPIDGNARYGCCTYDGVVHLKESWHAKYGLDYDAPDETEVVAAYLVESPGDTGCVEAEVLKRWHTKGLFGSALEAYAPVEPTNLLGLHQSVAFYDGAYLGILCGAPQQEQFERGEPWKYTGSAEEDDGHCVVALGYNAHGELLAATWGGIATLTAGYLAHKLEEAWCVVSGILVARRQDALGLDLAALQADLARV